MYFLDDARTVALDVAKVESWGWRYRGCAKVHAVASPAEARRDGGVVALIEGEWVRVWCGRGRAANGTSKAAISRRKTGKVKNVSIVS